MSLCYSSTPFLPPLSRSLLSLLPCISPSSLYLTRTVICKSDVIVQRLLLNNNKTHLHSPDWSAFYGSPLINRDTVNLLRLNLVSPCQPCDRNTHREACAHTHLHAHTLFTHTRAYTQQQRHLIVSWLGNHGDQPVSLLALSCTASLLSASLLPSYHFQFEVINHPIGILLILA